MTSAFAIELAQPFLIATFKAPHDLLSWSLTRPGFVTATRVAWLQVSDADLPLDVDPAAVLTDKMVENGLGDAVPMMTSRRVDSYEVVSATSGTIIATCLATTGLSNASRIGDAPVGSNMTGTINILAHVDCPFSAAGLVEAISIVTEARTAAVMDLGLDRGSGLVTGTGTDCIVVAAPAGSDREDFAGLHTHAGTAIGRSVYDAVLAGGRAWMDEQRLICEATFADKPTAAKASVLT